MSKSNTAVAESNLIYFPGKKPGLVDENNQPISSESQRPDDHTIVITEEQKIKSTKDFTERVSLDMMGYLFLHMTLTGTNNVVDEDHKDVMLVIESMRSLMQKSMGIVHPLQSLSQELFSDPAESTRKMIREMAAKSPDSELDL